MRGVAGTTRATRFGRVKDYAKRAHEEICVLVQVETKPALDQLEAICAVDGVDGVFIGPADLHASMGYTGETANPAVLPLIEEAMRRIRKAGKAPGYLSPVEADAKRMLAAGCLFCAVGADIGLLARGAEALRAKFQIMKKHEIVITAQGHKGTHGAAAERIFGASSCGKPPTAMPRSRRRRHVRALAHFGHSKVDGKLMDALPKLEIISNFGVGVDQIDLEAAKKRKIIVTNTPDVLNDCVADTAMALVLNTLRKFPQSEAYLRAGYWPTKGPIRSPPRSAARRSASSASGASARRSPSARRPSA